MVSKATVGNVTFCPSKKDKIAEGQNCRMKKYHFLNINPSNMIVLKFHMVLLYIYHQTVSKQCFLVGESRYQMYIFKV